MSATKRCTQCQRELSVEQFSKKPKSKDGFQFVCKECNVGYIQKRRQIGTEIRRKIMDESEGCQNPSCCSSPEHGRLLITGYNYGLFDLDHINESLKLHRYEVESAWIVANEDEFWTRIKPNVQVLCRQCHLFKTSKSRRTGGAVYQKIHGRKPPLQFIDPGYDLFNNVERVDISVDDDGEICETPIYSKGFHEDGWFVQRDLDGFLISYLELQDGEGKYFMYDKDGERIL